eukprot:13661363-Ditylum_brightwellii.AAC.1
MRLWWWGENGVFCCFGFWRLWVLGNGAAADADCCDDCGLENNPLAVVVELAVVAVAGGGGG